MRVIKRISAESIASGAQIRPPTLKVPSNDRREMVNVVKGWIVERAANRRTEKTDAARSLFAWKTAADATAKV